MKQKNNLKNLKIKKMNHKINSLYIHIPFCKRICPYCDFVKFIYNESFLNQYLVELKKDLDQLIQKRYKFKTIYIGGGTPSILSSSQICDLFSKITPLLEDSYEFTIELNPENIDENILKTLKNNKINRISIGIQTFNTRLLKLIDRDYAIDIPSKIELAKNYFSNINVDLIYGILDETFEELKHDVEVFLKLDIPHISTYSLIIDGPSLYNIKGYKETSDEILRKYYDYILDNFRKNGFSRYEVSNFAKPGFESKHNITYWKNEEYIALGVGASGYINNIRYKNSASLTKYIKGIRDGVKEEVSQKDDIEYFLLCNLRLQEGFLLETFKNRYNIDILDLKKSEISDLINRNLIKIENNRLFCTDEGIMLLDFVLEKLF